MRNTVQKKLIRDTVTMLDHPTAEEVYHALHKDNPAISRATVYRNLNAMEEQGELLKVAMPSGADIFDKTTMRHYHIKCTRCGKVSDLPHFAFPDPQTIATDYHITDWELVFFGTCPHCTE